MKKDDYEPMGVGWTELILIAAIVLLLFGGRKLPELSRGLGKSIRNFKMALRGDDDIKVRRIPDDSKDKDKQEPAPGGEKEL